MDKTANERQKRYVARQKNNGKIRRQFYLTNYEYEMVKEALERYRKVKE